MSGENAALLRLGYEAINRGDLDTFMSGIHPDVEYESVLVGVEGSSAVFRGREGMRRWLEDFHSGDIWSSWRLWPTEISEADDTHVVAKVEFDAVARTSGVPMHVEFGVVYTFRDALVVRVEDHPTIDAALEALDLPRWKLWRWRSRERPRRRHLTR